MAKRSPVVELACLLRDDAIHRERLSNLEVLAKKNKEIEELEQKTIFLDTELNRLRSHLTSKEEHYREVLLDMIGIYST